MACITATTSRFASVVPADISISGGASNANLFLVDGANIVDVGSNRTVEWRSQCLYNRDDDFVFASERLKGRKPLDLASVLKKKIQPAFKSIGIVGVGWHTFRHTVGTILAEMGEHQLTIRDYLRHSNLHVTNKYLQATSKTERLAQDKLVDAILPVDFLRKTTLIQ